MIVRNPVTNAKPENNGVWHTPTEVLVNRHSPVYACVDRSKAYHFDIVNYISLAFS